MSRKHWPVNWVDGMKITKEHFQAQEAHLTEQLALVTGGLLTDDNFGLLDHPSASGASLDLAITTDEVVLTQCRAITRGGHLIVVNEANNATLRHPMAQLVFGGRFKEGEQIVLLLRIDPDERELIGSPDNSEYPLRQPFAGPRLRLEVIAKQHARDLAVYHHAVPLAEMTYVYQGATNNTSYVIPAVRAALTEGLTSATDDWKKRLLDLEGNAYEIIRKIRDKHRNKLGNQLSTDLLALTEATIRYIAANYDRLSQSLPQAPASETVVWFKALARTVRTELRLAGNQESMLRYLAYFIREVGPTDLMEHCNVLCDHSYHHAFIRDSLTHIDTFLEFMDTLFGQLRQLDYHDIATPTIIDGRYFNQRDQRTVGQSESTTPPKTPSTTIRIKSRNSGPGGSTPSPTEADPPNGDGWGLE